MQFFLLIYPFAELYAWYKFIDSFSFLDAVALILTGGVLGILILMLQGRSVLIQTQASLASGQVPANALIHRGLVMLGGLLILVPGLLSKFAGILLVMPGFRHLAVIYLKWALSGKIANGSFRVFMSTGFPGGFNTNTPTEREVVDVTPSEIERKKYD
jgi:UPF0716 protein FxsA